MGMWLRRSTESSTGSELNGSHGQIATGTTASYAHPPAGATAARPASSSISCCRTRFWLDWGRPTWKCAALVVARANSDLTGLVAMFKGDPRHDPARLLIALASVATSPLPGCCARSPASDRCCAKGAGVCSQKQFHSGSDVGWGVGEIVSVYAKHAPREIPVCPVRFLKARSALVMASTIRDAVRLVLQELSELQVRNGSALAVMNAALLRRPIATVLITECLLQA